MLRGVLAIRGQAAARGYGFIAVEGREDDVFVLRLRGNRRARRAGDPWGMVGAERPGGGDRRCHHDGPGRPGVERAAAAGRERLD